MEQTEEKNHAKENAIAHLETIVMLYKVHKLQDRHNSADTESLKELLELREDEELTIVEEYINNYGTQDVYDTVNELPLSFLVRSGWYNPFRDSASNELEEFEILLSTGGPACKIYGTFGKMNGGLIEDCSIYYQDWFTQWEILEIDDNQFKAVEWFCEFFACGIEGI